MMFNEIIKLVSSYGWAALVLIAAAILLFHYVRTNIPVWRQRDDERTDREEDATHEQLLNNQFFSKLKHILYNEVPSLPFSPEAPVRQKLLRRLVELKLLSLQHTVEGLVEDYKETNKMTSTEWANYIIMKIHEGDDKFEEAAIHAGIPSVAFSKFMIWQVNTVEILTGYVNNLAVSTIYATNTARINTLLYILSLQLITIVGDAERTLMELNGELSGITYNGEILE